MPMPPLDAYALHAPNGGRVLALRALVGLTGADPEDRSRWVHVAYEGEWKGHGDGPFTLTNDDFAACIEAFKSQANPIRVDYDHASLRPPDGQPTPSAGYIQDLEIRSDGLWAFVEFTPRCAAMIRGGEQRFCSAVFAWGRPDRKSGAEVRCQMHSLAMTDTPFIDGQQPIALSANHAALRALTGGTMKIKREALMALLEKIEGDEIEAEQLHAAVEAAAAEAIAIDGPPKDESVDVDVADLAALPAKDEKLDGKDKPADKKLADEKPTEDAAALAGDISQEGAATDFVPAAEDVVADAGAMVASRLMEASGLDEAGLLAAIETNLDAVVAALQGVGAASDALPMSDSVAAQKVAVLSETLGNVKARLAKYEAADKANASRALDGEIEALVKDGKILPGAKARWRALAARDLAGFRALAVDLPRVVPLGDEAGGIDASAASQLDNVIDMSSPQVRALSESMDRMGVKDPAIREKHMRAAIDRTRSAG